MCVRESHSASGRDEREVGRECGNKDREKRKEMERESFAQPSITFLGFKFIWLHFSLKYTTHKRGRGAGGRREREEDGGIKQHREGRGGGEEYTAGGKTTWE